MEWETDQRPIDYLKRRIIYYKKKRATVKNLATNAHLLNRYTAEQLKGLVGGKVLFIDKMIKQFEKAVKKLELNQTQYEYKKS